MMTFEEVAKAAAAVFCRIRLHSERTVSERVARNNFRFDCDTGRIQNVRVDDSPDAFVLYHNCMQAEVTRIRSAEDCCRSQVPT